MTMDLDRLQEALKDFDKRVKKEVCPVLDEFLCHVAKTGETMFQWSQIKTYFMFKLEKVMEDFKTSAPEARGPSNPNVEYIPYEEMKERILKIVSGFNGIPFTIQRLCELLTEPRRNYSGTDKFLRGVEKNVMVVSCVHPTSEKTNSHSLNRMNGVMFPGNSPSYTDRSNINGPGTPRPLNRPKLSLSNPMTTNGLPDSTENKDLNLQQTEDKLHSDATTIDSPQGSTIKNKHSEEDYVEAEGHEVKRLKFDQEEEDEDDDDDHDAASPPLPGEAASEMAEEAGPCSRSPEKDTEISCAGLQTTTSEEDEESYMTATEVTSESSDAEKDANDIVSVSEETCDENEMEESDQCEAKDVHSGVDHSSCAVSTASECSGTEELVTFASEAAEVPSESMDNGEDASEVAEEPMEQD